MEMEPQKVTFEEASDEAVGHSESWHLDQWVKAQHSSFAHSRAASAN